MLIDEGLEVLTEAEAWSLLATVEVGRVGLSIGALPAILPVNFRVIDHTIVYRSSPGLKVTAAAEGAVVAFEADSFDTTERTGWSVLVVGQSTLVNDIDTTYKVLDAELEPYAEGQRSVIVSIEGTFISGRRIHRTPKGQPDGQGTA